jgi:hypothetical protein
MKNDRYQDNSDRSRQQVLHIANYTVAYHIIVQNTIIKHAVCLKN